MVVVVVRLLGGLPLRLVQLGLRPSTPRSGLPRHHRVNSSEIGQLDVMVTLSEVL